MKKLTLLIVILLLSGCTTAGPFVTNISKDNQGNLVVEKAKVVYHLLFGVIGTKYRTTETVK